MSNPLALPIARLRAAGCKVNTIIGHDPAIGDFVYGVTLPDGMRRPSSHLVGYASIRQPATGPEVVVSAHAYRRGLSTPASLIAEYRDDVATALERLAGYVEKAAR